MYDSPWWSVRPTVTVLSTLQATSKRQQYLLEVPHHHPWESNVWYPRLPFSDRTLSIQCVIYSHLATSTVPNLSLSELCASSPLLVASGLVNIISISVNQVWFLDQSLMWTPWLTWRQDWLVCEVIVDLMVLLVSLGHYLPWPETLWLKESPIYVLGQTIVNQVFGGKKTEVSQRDLDSYLP